MIETLGTLLSASGHNWPDPPSRQAFAPAPAPDDDYWYSHVPGGLLAQYLGGDQALKVAAVDACIRVLSETVASLPCHVYRRQEDEGRVKATGHPLYSLLHNAANDYQTAFEFYEWLMRSMLIDGAALAILTEDAERNVVEMEPVDWRQVRLTEDKPTGIRTFTVHKPDGSLRVYTDSEVLFIPGPGCSKYEVTSIVQRHAAAIGLSLASQEYVRNYFTRGALGPVFVTFPNPMGKDAVQAWADEFKKHQGAMGAHNVPVFSHGGEIKKVDVQHDKMQLVELRNFQVEEVARIFRVPPHLIQALQRSTNNNIEHQGIDFATHTIRPWLERIEARLNLSLFGPIEGLRYYAEFDMSALLRGDSQGQAAILAATIQNAVMKPNEWRDKLNLSRVPEGDDLLIQGATVPLRLAGQLQQ